MRVSGHDHIGGEKLVHESNGATKEAQIQQEKNAQVSAPDRVELSSKAKDIQRIKEILEKVPEIRENRVEEAKKALESGTLQLGGKERADKIIRDSLQNA